MQTENDLKRTRPDKKSADNAFRVDAEKIRLQIRRWQEKVLDLTKSNPLLGLNRSKVAKLRVTKPKAADLFLQLVIDANQLRMPLVRKKTTAKPTVETVNQDEPKLDVQAGDLEFEASPQELMRRVRRIYDNARTTVEERGVTTLHMTFGALHWRDELFGDSVSPLWMVPCELESKGPDAPLRLSLADEEMQLNPALEYCLRERHKLELPQLPDEPTATSLQSFLASATTAVREQGWQITDEVWLSTFTFESLVIYQDLKAMVHLAGENRVVSALARAMVLSGQSEALPEDLDSVFRPASSPLPILPTDSSQLEALTFAAAGRNVVVHGPPGTGKSQTITNLIADALARQEKVLFVSAKMAALNVVYERLKELGLERFCLEAHSTKAGKMKIIDALRRTLETETASCDNSLDEELQNLMKLRHELNGYVQDLHKRIEPLGLSIYQSIGKIAKLHKAPDIRAPLPQNDALAIDRPRFHEYEDVLTQLGSMTDVFDARLNHPWRGFNSEKIGLDAKDQIEAALQRLVESSKSLSGHLKQLSPMIGDNRCLTMTQLEHFGDGLDALPAIRRLPRGWWTQSSNQLGASAGQFENASARATEFCAKEKQLRAYISLPLIDAAEFLSSIETKFQTWYKRLSPAFWRWRSELKRACKPGARLDLNTIRSQCAVARRLVEIQRWFSDHRGQLVQEAGAGDLKNPQELSRIALQFRVAEKIQKAFSDIGLQAPAGCEELPAEIHKAAAVLRDALPSRNVGLKGAIEVIHGGWPNGFSEDFSPTDIPLPGLIARAEEVLAAIQEMREWVLLDRVLRKCQTFGLTPFVNALGSTSAASAPTAFQRRFYTVWTSAALQKFERLVEFRSGHRRDLIRKFGILDATIRRLAAARVQSVASQASMRIRSAQDNIGPTSEVGILRYELQKKKRVKPLRKTFAEIPHVLQALKPCMLMSPISVSTYLKPGLISFDLVVFDEASQLPTAEAVPSVLRARRVIVAGDANQLPPTSFFEAALLTDDETEEDGAAAQEPLESLLDDCVAIVPVFQESFLRWHYRSRDERLIKFSNHYFYENRLITFPSSITKAEGRGVRLVYVNDGVWDRGRSRTNRQEARTVAGLALEHFDKYPHRSLGIVAMNTTQREAIEDAIQEELQHRPDLHPFFDSGRTERMFVKSLENVQGDERDTMLISVGYGKDINGGLSYNFGPINTDGGWRRLNVLVTRAKWETILVTSLRSDELNGVNPHNRGAVSLRNFIAFAEQRAVLPNDAPTISGAETNDFEDAVRSALLERGFSVDAQVGSSRYRIDLAVRDKQDPSRYLIGIECDGASYHGSRTARDRDILRQEVLHGMGWRLHRVWSTEWFYDRQNAIDSMLRSIEQAESGPLGQTVHAPSSSRDSLRKPAPGANQSSAVGTRRFSTGVPYRRYGCHPARSREYILQSVHVLTLAAAVADIVRVEGPIHQDILLERLKELHGIERAGSNVQENVRRASQFASKDSIEIRSDGFLCANGSPVKSFRVATNEVRRSFEFIPREEVELAILYIVEDQFGMMREQIPQVVARLFGIDRLRAEAADSIRSSVDALVEKGLLRTSGPHVYIA